MNQTDKRVLFFILLLMGQCLCAHPLENTRKPGIGSGARIFVTKCYPAHGKLSEADFKQLADAGFTVAVNRWPADYPAYCQKAAKVGLDVMSWDYGLVSSQQPEQYIVTRKGKTIPKYPPCDKEGWVKISELLVKGAELSLKYPNAKGIALDYEIYHKDKTGGYCESYDDRTLTSFFRACDMAIPKPLPPPAKRRAYLKRKGLLKKFIRYQYNQVALEVKAIRKRLDAINPRFQVGVYGWGDMIGAVIENITSAEAPVLRLEAGTYGRTRFSNAFTGGYDANEPDRRGLRWSLCEIARRRDTWKKKGYPVVVLAGHYPQSPGPADGTQYKFTVRQSYNSAAYGDGYWIWSNWRAPKPWASKQNWIDAMMAYWKEAHTALDNKDYTWSIRQSDQISDPKATPPRPILTSNGETTTAWHPTTGKRVSEKSSKKFPKTRDQTFLSFPGKKLQIHKQSIVIKNTKDNTVRTLFIGKNLHGFAIGDVDTVPGEELVTLNDGWVQIRDIDSGACLLQFRVGTDQTEISLAAVKRMKSSKRTRK